MGGEGGGGGRGEWAGRGRGEGGENGRGGGEEDVPFFCVWEGKISVYIQ
jgi:hypothetical protein